jgi:RNAse (barnase) inhibitor barstar
LPRLILTGRDELDFRWFIATILLRQFSVRGLGKAGMEALWACLTHNIRVWIRLRWRRLGEVVATAAE